MDLTGLVRHGREERGREIEDDKKREGGESEEKVRLVEPFRSNWEPTTKVSRSVYKTPEKVNRRIEKGRWGP